MYKNFLIVAKPDKKWAAMIEKVGLEQFNGGNR